MTALPDQLRDFDSELAPAPRSFFATFGWTPRTAVDRDYIDELQAWAGGFEPQPQWITDPPGPDAPCDVVAQVDRAAGEYFRGTWRRRLADAQGDCGYVARQMRKAGVPLDLALLILLLPETMFEPTPWPAMAPDAGGAPTRESDSALPRPRPALPSLSLRFGAAT